MSLIVSKMPSFSEILDDLLVKYLAYFNYKNYTKGIDLRGNEKLLEIGCGGGNLSRFLAERLPLGKVVCIDSSKYWIEKAKDRLKKFRNVEFRLGDVLDFKRENYFDVVVAHYVLHDITKKERKKAVEILSRSLKPKGLIYIREPIRKSHGMPSEEIKSLMLKRGFSEENSKEGYSFPLRGKVCAGIFTKLRHERFKYH